MPVISLHILLLGGTSEASALARRLAEENRSAVFSYAGRTASPRPQPLPTRIGGFGGVDGLVDYIRSAGISHLIDATHPFAAQMSRHAVNAARLAHIPVLRFERPAWNAAPGDTWTHVPDIDAAMPEKPGRIFLAIGRQHVAPFLVDDRHFWLLRFVDDPGDFALPAHAAVEIDAGPFGYDNDRALLEKHQITRIITKNSGGTGARAKLDAARDLGIPVTMIDRPPAAGGDILHDVDDVMAWLDQS